MLLEDIEDGLYRYRAVCKVVIDGDTLKLDIDLGIRTHNIQNVRLLGINTPEICGRAKNDKDYEKGLAAGEEVARLLKPEGLGRYLKRHVSPDIYAGEPTPLWIRTKKDKVGRYGRFLADVWFWREEDATVVSLKKHLLDKGLAYEVIT
jgi:endonuclease YncB( thermonuclease family)